MIIMGVSAGFYDRNSSRFCITAMQSEMPSTPLCD
jgi:hypothetical protein